MSYFDFEVRLPCKIFTPEEIQAEYGARSIRPIPEGYKKPRLTARNRMDLQKNVGHNKPWAVYAQHGDGRRIFISSHHSDTAAENKAETLNSALSKVSDFVYTIGERKEPNDSKNPESETVSEEDGTEDS